jgi:MFS family permease
MSRMAKPGSLTALLVHSMLIQAITFLVRPASTYQAIDLNVPSFALGVIGASFAIVPLVLAVPSGGLVDRFGERSVMLVGASLTVLASGILLVWGTSLGGILAGTGVLGAGHLACIVSQQTIVANSATKGRLDSMFGYYTFAASLGQAIGPLAIALAGGSQVQPDTHLLFVIGLVMSAALVVTTFFVQRPARMRTSADAGEPTTSWTLLRSPGVARALSTSAIVVAAVDLTVIYIPALGAERGLTAGSVGVMLAVRAAFSMIARFFLGRISSRIGRARLMTLSIVIAAVGLSALAIPLPVWAMFALAALLGLGLGVGQPLTMSWLIEQTPPGRRGRALSLRLAGNRLSQVALPAAVGAAAATLGAGAVLLSTGVLVAGTLLLLRGVRLDGDR